MKRLSYLLSGLAILLFVMVGCASRVDEKPETAVPTNENPTDVSDTQESDDAVTGEETAVLPAEDLPLLPRFDASQAAGFGGGGGITEIPVAESDAFTSSIAPDSGFDTGLYYVDVFSGTTFVLNGTLPTDIVREVVQQHTPAPISLEEATQLAIAFGFSGSLYKNPEYTFINEAGVEQVENVSTTFYAFDGLRTLSIDPFGVYYYDGAFSFEYEQPSDLALLTSMAEAFLQAHGLLTFEYTVDRIWGNDIGFYRQINGRSLDQPEITVSLTSNGDIVSVSVQPMNNLQTLGNYPLRSAEDAWQLILDGVADNNIRYNNQPIDIDFAQPIVIEPDFIDQYRYWARAYQPNAEVHIYTWPSIYFAADNVSAPRIEAYPFILQADDATLSGIAADPFNQYHIWGQAGENGRLLQVAGWEILPNEQEALYLQGTVQYEGEQALFVTDSGETYLLPDAPLDIPTESQLDLFGWAIRDNGGLYPMIDWESIDLFIDYGLELEPGNAGEGYPVPVDEPISIDGDGRGFVGEPELFAPDAYEQVTIDTVTLIYSFTYIYPEFEDGGYPVPELGYQQPPVILQPVWQFSGTAVNGDQINLFVDAVAPEYFQ